MMKMDSKLVDQGSQKAKHLAVLAFFLCALPSLQTHAASNTVNNSTVYGPDFLLATAGSIISIADGTTDLQIQYDGTTNLFLNNEIIGTVSISNSFSSFTIQSTGNASITASGAPALEIDGGNVLKIVGGNFSTTNTPPAGGGPPTPPSSENNIAIKISGTQHTTLDGTTVTGGSDSGIGGSAVKINDGTLVVTGDSVLTGGTGQSAIFAQTADLQITNGIFSGGTGGSTLLLRDGSTATIHDGTFNTQRDIYTFHLLDSSLQLHGGAVTNGLLLSQASDGNTNTVALHTGVFDSLLFQSATNGTQLLTTGTSLVVSNGIFQSGGNMVVSNLVADALPTVRLSNGASIEFLQDFTLSPDGVFWLDSSNERAVFSTLRLESGATLNMNEGLVSADYFEAGSFSTNRFVVTDEGTGRIDTQTAFFKTDSALIVDATAVGISSVETNDYALVSANVGQLFAGTDTNTAATAASFKANVNIETSASDRTRFVDLYFDATNGNTIVVFQFTAKALSEYWGLTNGTSTVVTEAFLGELDQLASSEMLGIIDSINDPAQSLAAIEEAYFTSPNTFQTAVQGLQAAVGQSVSRGAEFRDQLLLPPGAKGPERKNDLRGWAKYYGQLYSHDADGLNSEYDATLHGGVIGVDKSIGNLLLGISGGAGNYSSETINDGREDISAYHGALYGTFGTERAYFDAGIAYGVNDVETKTGGPFELNGEFDAQVLTAYFGAGYDLVDTKGGTVFTPEASIQYSTYEQDAYSETSTTAVPRNIDAFDGDSLRSSLGLNVSMLNTTALETVGFKLDGRFHWLHEFNPDPGNMTFSLEGGGNDYQLASPQLDEELFRVGFGFSFFNTLRQKPKNVLFRLDFDELFGDGFNSHNLSAKVIYAF